MSATNNDDQADGSETNNQDNSEDIQEVIPFPTDENLSEIVQELVDREFWLLREKENSRDSATTTKINLNLKFDYKVI